MRARLPRAVAILIMATLLASLPGLHACGGGESSKTSVVKVGFIADFTGIVSEASTDMANGVADWFRMVNQDDPIEGVTLDFITYDTKFDFGRVPAAFLWLKGQGAVLQLVIYQVWAEMLMGRYEEDKIPCFATGCTDITLESEWIFHEVLPTEWEAEVIMEWIWGQWDYAGMGRPPVVGFVCMSATPVSESITRIYRQMEADHPEKFSFKVQSAPMTNTAWAQEIGHLKDCDYIVSGLSGAGLASFLKQSRAMGYQGKFMGLPYSFLSSWDLVKSAVAPDIIDEALSSYPWILWTDTQCPIVAQADLNLSRFGREGRALNYLSGQSMGMIFVDAIRRAVEAVGAGNVDGSAIRDALTNTDITMAGWGEPLKFRQGDQICGRMTRICEYQVAKEDWFAITDWILPPEFNR